MSQKPLGFTARSFRGTPSRHGLVHILVREIPSGIREGQDLAAQLLEAQDRELALERVANDVAPRASRLLADLVEQTPKIRPIRIVTAEVFMSSIVCHSSKSSNRTPDGASPAG
jgi:hypothetical protein